MLVMSTLSPEARVGVYGPNPRFTADADRGRAQVDAAAALLAERAAGLLRGETFDPMADLRTFVERYWPEPLRLAGTAGGVETAAIGLTNPGPVSRYVSGLTARLDGEVLPPGNLILINTTAGETGVPFRVDELGPEHGFYVRRQQTATLLLGRAVSPGTHAVELVVQFAGVTETRLDQLVEFA